MAAVTQLATAVGTRAARRVMFAPRASLSQEACGINPDVDPGAACFASRSAPAERETVLAHLTENDSRTVPPLLFKRRCWMKDSISARSAPCTACSNDGGVPRAPRSTDPSDLPETGTGGHRSQSSLDLGHHQAAGARQVDVLLPLRDPRHLQPLRHRLDGGDPRKRRPGQAADPGELREQSIRPGQLTLHADRGTSMSSQTVALLLADLGVTKSHSRPHVSDDNPYSESQFRTMKYRPEFPDRFACIQDGRAFCRDSSTGRTTNTTTGAWACLPRPWSTTAKPRSSSNGAKPFSMPPIASIPNASSTRLPNQPRFPEVWINKPLNTNEKLTKFHGHWSQTA